MNPKSRAKKAAVILCGSGFKDGTEIREAVLTLLALDQRGFSFQCFAPKDNQVDVINCLNGEPLPETRSMIIEAARIARGDVRELDKIQMEHFDALIIPGGFGVAKNLCDFASKGINAKVREDIATIIHGFFDAKKPIGAICIAPIVLALTLREKHLTLTLGAESPAADAVRRIGHQHKIAQANECVIDPSNRIVTSPAYMHDDATLSEVFGGISKLVAALQELSS